MATVEISQDLADLASKQATLKGVTIAQLVSDAILEYISEQQAIDRAEEVMERIARGEEDALPWTDVKAELGL